MTTKEITQSQIDRLERHVYASSFAVAWGRPNWEEALKWAREIEDNPLNLDSVLLKLRNNVGYDMESIVEASYRVPESARIMFQVYVLMYYCHHDDEKYLDAVVNPMVGEIVRSSRRDLYVPAVYKVIDEMIEDERKLQACLPQINCTDEDVMRQNYHNNVMIELVTRLMEKAGMELTVVKKQQTQTSNYGNNAEAARLLSDIMGIPFPWLTVASLSPFWKP